MHSRILLYNWVLFLQYKNTPPLISICFGGHPPPLALREVQLPPLPSGSALALSNQQLSTSVPNFPTFFLFYFPSALASEIAVECTSPWRSKSWLWGSSLLVLPCAAPAWIALCRPEMSFGEEVNYGMSHGSELLFFRKRLDDTFRIAFRREFIDAIWRF